MFFKRLILWAFVPRKFKQCGGFCLRCPYFETCRVETRIALGLETSE